MLKTLLYATGLSVFISCCSHNSLSDRVFLKEREIGTVEMDYSNKTCMVYYESGPMIMNLGIRNIPRSLCDVFYNTIKKDIEKREIPSLIPTLKKD
ncbi:hypothetical protein J4436_03650 [Candidatus Woesearchaeota archaeon]|nr:hypothetical protein [Candidatus Woesearchaeota archaeon]